MGIFQLFQRKKAANLVELRTLKVDIHSHLLPGIDDGAKTMDHSIGMIRKFIDLGYQKLIITPHIMSGVYDNTSEIILSKLNEVRAACLAMGLDIELEASAEYYFDETLFERISKRDLLPFNGNHILFELSFRNEPGQLHDLIFTFKSAGYQPIIAHFERYMYYHGSVEQAKKLRDLGCMIQLNLNSLSGHYGPEVKKQALRLMKANLVDIAGSDCHRIEHLQLLEKHLTHVDMQKLLSLELKNDLFV